MFIYSQNKYAYYILTTYTPISYNTFVTWFECDVKFDFFTD